jgi:hypothetical protein
MKCIKEKSINKIENIFSHKVDKLKKYKNFNFLIPKWL